MSASSFALIFPFSLKKGNIYILDEPTTGLHPSDIEKVMGILDSFVNRGNTVIVIEHNTDVIRAADYVIEMGPGAGEKGGRICFCGTPAALAQSAGVTAQYL